MPPRIRIAPKHLRPVSRSQYVCRQCRHASVATTPAPDPTATVAPLIVRYPPTQPPSHKLPEFRKTQLHRQYQSLLRSSPLIVIFQHNNLKSTEWTGIRRELATAFKKVDQELSKQGNSENVGVDSRIQVVQTGIFASALRVVEFWDPQFEQESSTSDKSLPAAADTTVPRDQSLLTHGLSRAAWRASKDRTLKHGLEPLLTGPLAILSMPTVSPQHLKAALSILSPSTEFPAPKRKTNPGYHEPAVQSGLQKLMLLGARVEGKVFDMEGTKWVGGIQGGMDGLRAQLVAMLSGVGAGITTTLEAASKSLYLTVEGRRTMLEDESKS